MTNEQYVKLHPHLIDFAELSLLGWTRTQVNKIAPPDVVVDTGYHVSHFWLRSRFDGLTPPPTPRPAPAQEVDLLAAIFAVNRSAKRYRDAAQSLYSHGKAGQSGWGRYRHSRHAGSFTLSSVAKRKKESLYRLKDRGIRAAFHLGRIECQGKHGNVALWRGEGYCLHSCWIDQSKQHLVVPSDPEHIRVEAKPKTTKEVRLMDAQYTLELLAEPVVSTEGLIELAAPSFVRSKPMRSIIDEPLWGI